MSQSQQQYTSQVLPAKRGDIDDRNGTVLATSNKVYNVILDCKLVNTDEKYLEPTVQAMVNSLGVDETEIRNLLTENHDILDIAFECDGIVFSHAGFSRTWIKSVYKVLWDAEKLWSIDYLNEEWHKLSFNPHDEAFNYAFEELLDWYGFFSSSGNEITQDPLWIRPESLIKDAAYPVQVVGHTEFCLGDFIVLCDKDLSYDQKNTVAI